MSADPNVQLREWAERTLLSMERNDPTLLSTWFKFTKLIAKKPLGAVLDLEEKLMSSKGSLW
jgi:hypothetical protein